MLFIKKCKHEKKKKETKLFFSKKIKHTSIAAYQPLLWTDLLFEVYVPSWLIAIGVLSASFCLCLVCAIVISCTAKSRAVNFISFHFSCEKKNKTKYEKFSETTWNVNEGVLEKDKHYFHKYFLLLLFFFYNKKRNVFF